jgi:uncharacterized membrane protein YeaQ/YmgE (transglycosylase-associated protein family)
VLGTVVTLILSGFVVGALARLAVPGPDPMPIWLTVAIGLGGSLTGQGIAYGAGARNLYILSSAGFVAAIVLVIAYRRFVQKRPITGAKALRYPERGVGVPEYRERLRRVGIDPDTLPLGRPPQGAAEQEAESPAASEAEPAAEDVLTAEERTEALRRLAEQRDEGELTAEEYRERRRRLVYGEDG